MIQVTEQQLHLLHHTLGLEPARRTPYRNHFVAGAGHHDMPDLLVLEGAGLMKRVPTPAFCDKGDIVFACTPAGKDHAVLNLALPPKRTRYDEYRDCEYSESFGYWLVGENLPKFEWSDDRYSWWLPEVQRRERYRMTSRRAEGEWAFTKKDAKASYKSALAEVQRREREWRKEALAC